MCLTKVEQIYDEPLEEERVGYKAMRTVRHDSDFHTLSANVGYAVGKWYTATREDGMCLSVSTLSGIIYLDDAGDKIGEYAFGFHCFRDLRSAVNYAQYFLNAQMVRVRYRKIVASGLQGCWTTDVAQEMFIEGPVSDAECEATKAS